MIFVYELSLDGNECKYLNDCIDFGWVFLRGKYIDCFEIEFVEFLKVKYVIIVFNGIVVLYLVMSVLGII